MLKQRIITALILGSLTLLALFYAPPPLFIVLTGALTLLAAVEWTNLMAIKKIPSRLFYLGLIVLSALLSVTLISFHYISSPLILAATFLWWLCAAALVIGYPRVSACWSNGLFWRGLMGLLVMVPCWIAINYIFIQPDGRVALLYLFVLIWGADSTAYFVGKKWGKTKLAPLVSPGKSVQGLLGALVFTIFAAIIIQLIYQTPVDHWYVGIILSLVTVLFSVLGDLFESMLKRQVGLKDSGSILPGHGGILDRIDSLTAAAPVFAFGSWLLGKYFSS